MSVPTTMTGVTITLLITLLMLIGLLLIVSALHRPPPAAATGDPVTQPDGLACQELLDLVTDYFDGGVLPDLKNKLQEHLSGCDGCAEYVRQIGLTIRALQQADLQLTSRPRAAAAGTRALHPAAVGSAARPVPA
ncbi:MAG: transporter [Actinomycetia bacterium]|nr:transporter [Actinomycetes bacterium]